MGVIDIRKLIRRRRNELQGHGIISTVAINQTGRGRPAIEFWLNEQQCYPRHSLTDHRSSQVPFSPALPT